MGERSIHGVQIAVTNRTISIPWKSRQALLAELRPIEAMHEVVLAFEAVGTSRPVELTAEQKDDLHGVLTGWAQETEGGFTALPKGISELSNALYDDLHRNSPT